MMRTNPELLSREPTHRFRGVLVKVFSDRDGPCFDFQGRRVATAEIMEGPSKGLWTTVYFDQAERLDGVAEATVLPLAKPSFLR